MLTSPDHLIKRLKQELNPNMIGENDCIDDATPAAVLVPFFFIQDQWHLLFTKRTNDVGTHQGEISFPGGSADVNDRNLIQTALRETREEIGVEENDIEVLGLLDPVPTVSRFCVLPVVGIVKPSARLELNSGEVEKIIQIPVSWLMEENNWHECEFLYEPGKSRPVIHYKDYDNEHLWGLTARIAQNVLSFLK